MTPSEKEKIIKDSYEAIKDLYIHRNELLTDAGKLEAVRESNRKLSDRVANLEETINILNSVINKKDVEIKSLREELELLRKAHAKLCRDYNALSKTTVTEANFHELREQISRLYLYYLHDVLQSKEVTAFAHWFTETFGDFGINDEEE